VVVKKNNGEIHLCVDFKDLNRMSIEYNYPLPNMEMLLQQVTGSALISMLVGLYGYNQVLIVEEYRPTNVFITPWGTYSYVHMSFELNNVGATSKENGPCF
jgi:hypothetical protein